ncbi:DUF2252 family protein [Xylophilus sp. GOD-11R]|uniref:DUF2252 family protein n=1 Tax=Xylophilus sp. GOD-11R TaxID=3089814 RepID=UPI00298D5BDE|nr:DUF2252 family protein [Xylophilus sp. GOD-11R]WPB55418.1 DUF2252 family protein [Xylophilus sp. GOD-11R]
MTSHARRLPPAPDLRQAVLLKAKNLKMATSAHAYVRGNTLRFYEWLENAGHSLPEGPPIWICGDCHVGNLGPLANTRGKARVRIRDFDQTVLGNPAHDLVRLALSLSMAARSSDLPGVVTARMVEQVAEGYESAFGPPDDIQENLRPDAVQVALKSAQQRTWRHLAQERTEGKTVAIPLGKRFWPVSEKERTAIHALFDECTVAALLGRLERRESDGPVRVLDVAYWMKGCSSLGNLRYAVLLDVGGRASTGKDLCLIDLKEAVKAAAPRAASSGQPRDNALRVLEGARHLSPHLGSRMAGAHVLGRAVVLRELLPQDLKLELAQVDQREAMRAARFLAHVVGRAHARQMSVDDRQRWKAELASGRKAASLDAPAWLWNSTVDLIASHERGYLEHCRRYALETFAAEEVAELLT